MDLKQWAVNAIGQERLSAAKGLTLHCLSLAERTLQGKKPVETEAGVRLTAALSLPGYHVFRGYYDIDYLNADGDRFLCHRLPKGAGAGAICEAGFFRLSDPAPAFEPVARTRAWCWQQGSRLRWIGEDLLMLNTADETACRAQVWSAGQKRLIRQLDHPLYDVTGDLRTGLTLNFSRLQRLRPGYGYSLFPDPSEGQNAPGDDGVFLVSPESGKTELMHSLADLADRVDPERAYVHYVNHISLSPAGDRFLFFHIFARPGESTRRWKTVLYVSDLSGRLTALEETDRVSHYCWTGEDRIMVTCRREDGTEYYCVFDLRGGEKNVLVIPELNTDGHPCPLGDGRFVTDTYPKRQGIQTLRLFRPDGEHARTLARVYHDFRRRGETRCDLHPSFALSRPLLSVDSTCRGGKRSVLLFELTAPPAEQFQKG